MKMNTLHRLFNTSILLLIALIACNEDSRLNKRVLSLEVKEMSKLLTEVPDIPMTPTYEKNLPTTVYEFQWEDEITIGTCDRCVHPFKVGDKVRTNDALRECNHTTNVVEGVIVAIHHYDGTSGVEICTGDNHHERFNVSWVERVPVQTEVTYLHKGMNVTPQKFKELVEESGGWVIFYKGVE